MNDFDALLSQVLGQAKAIGLPVHPHIDPHVQVNHRAQTRYGRCVGNRLRGYVIELSAKLLEAPAQSCREILAHEILHTCRGCQNHQARWKQYAARMNERFGYDIRTTADPERLGLPQAKPVRYRLRCQSCGAQLERMRRSPLVAHPERYRCRCGGRLLLLDEPEAAAAQMPS